MEAPAFQGLETSHLVGSHDAVSVYPDHEAAFYISP